MIRLLIFLFLAYLLYRLVRGLLAPVTKSGGKGKGGVVDEMVQDPACQTYIPLRDAKRKVIHGQEYFFCSKECCEKFENEIKTKGGV